MATIIEQTRCAPCARARGLSGLGETNIIDSILNVGHTIWGDVTGATANQKAQENALALAKTNAEVAIEEAKARRS
mgnify:FL=1